MELFEVQFFSKISFSMGFLLDSNILPKIFISWDHFLVYLFMIDDVIKTTTAATLEYTFPQAADTLR